MTNSHIATLRNTATLSHYADGLTLRKLSMP